MTIIVIIVVIALLFNFTNGFNDSGNIVATMISTRAINPIPALILASVCECIGAIFLGTKVAHTIVGGIIQWPVLMKPESTWMLFSALVGALVWNLCSWRLAVPSSSSHALMGGIIGAFTVGKGITVIQWDKMSIILIIMFLAPMVTFIVAYFSTRFFYCIGQWMTPRTNTVFKHLQIISSIALALSHGTNDAQKTMGVITIALIATGWLHPAKQSIIIPVWVILSCAGVIALGMGIGAQRIIHTLGRKIYKMQPLDGFCSQVSAALMMYTASLCGYVVSTSQVVSTSITGAGAAKGIKKVHWQTVFEIVGAWAITMPVAGCIAGGCYYLIKVNLP